MQIYEYTNLKNRNLKITYFLQFLAKDFDTGPDFTCFIPQRKHKLQSSTSSHISARVAEVCSEDKGTNIVEAIDVTLFIQNILHYLLNICHSCL